MRHKIVIQRHRPWLKPAVIAGTASVLLIGAVAIYGVTRKTTVSNYNEAQSALEQLRDERRELSRELRAARNEIEKLKQDNVFALRSQEIDSQACATVKQSLSAMQQQSAGLREQLAFYRGIVSPQESQAGLRVLEIKARPTEEPGVWELEYVLIQSQRPERRAQGTVNISLIGSQAGQARTLQLDELLTPQTKAGGYSFKSFQEFSARFRLPDGFRPMQVTVRLEPEGKATAPLEESFEWNRMTADSAPMETR